MSGPEASRTEASQQQTPSERKNPLGPGEPQKTITMAAIAKAAGVSQGAISSLLNDRDYGIRVSEKTRNLVFKVCREMGYIPNDLRAVVRMYPELGDLCLLISDSKPPLDREPFLTRILSAAMASVSGFSQNITLARFQTDFDYNSNLDKLPQPVQASVVSKFLIFGEPNPSLLQILIRRGYPVSCLDTGLSMPGVSCYLPDYQQASRLALERLFNLGHRNVVILSGPFGSSDWRINELNRGARLAFEQAGIAIQPQNIVYGDLSFQSGQLAARNLLTQSSMPTAVFGFSDTVAAGFLSGALSHGMRVPEQISVMGCGDDPIALLTAPALSTVHLPAEEMADTAVKELEETVRQEQPDLTASRRLVVPVRLVERGSCSAPN